jgi:hypothetical protein
MCHVAHMGSASVSRKTKGHVFRGSVYKAGPYQKVQTQSGEGIQNPRGRNTQQGISYKPYPRNYIAICLLFEMLCSVLFFLPENIEPRKQECFAVFILPYPSLTCGQGSSRCLYDRRVENVSTKGNNSRISTA